MTLTETGLHPAVLDEAVSMPLLTTLLADGSNSLTEKHGVEGSAKHQQLLVQ